MGRGGRAPARQVRVRLCRGAARAASHDSSSVEMTSPTRALGRQGEEAFAGGLRRVTFRHDPRDDLAAMRDLHLPPTAHVSQIQRQIAAQLGDVYFLHDLVHPTPTAESSRRGRYALSRPSPQPSPASGRGAELRSRKRETSAEWRQRFARASSAAVITAASIWSFGRDPCFVLSNPGRSSTRIV